MYQYLGKYKNIVTKHAELGSEFFIIPKKTFHSKIRLKDGFAPKMAWQEKKIMGVDLANLQPHPWKNCVSFTSLLARKKTAAT